MRRVKMVMVKDMYKLPIDMKTYMKQIYDKQLDIQEDLEDPFLPVDLEIQDDPLDLENL
jgi:hypothetical protein